MEIRYQDERIFGRYKGGGSAAGDRTATDSSIIGTKWMLVDRDEQKVAVIECFTEHFY